MISTSPDPTPTHSSTGNLTNRVEEPPIGHELPHTGPPFPQRSSPAEGPDVGPQPLRARRGDRALGQPFAAGRPFVGGSVDGEPAIDDAAQTGRVSQLRCDPQVTGTLRQEPLHIDQPPQPTMTGRPLTVGADLDERQFSADQLHRNVTEHDRLPSGVGFGRRRKVWRHTPRQLAPRFVGELHRDRRQPLDAAIASGRRGKAEADLGQHRNRSECIRSANQQTRVVGRTGTQLAVVSPRRPPDRTTTDQPHRNASLPEGLQQRPQPDCHELVLDPLFACDPRQPREIRLGAACGRQGDADPSQQTVASRVPDLVEIEVGGALRPCIDSVRPAPQSGTRQGDIEDGGAGVATTGAGHGHASSAACWAR